MLTLSLLPVNLVSESKAAGDYAEIGSWAGHYRALCTLTMCQSWPHRTVPFHCPQTLQTKKWAFTTPPLLKESRLTVGGSPNLVDLVERMVPVERKIRAKIISIHSTLESTLVLELQLIQTGSVLMLLPLFSVLDLTRKQPMGELTHTSSIASLEMFRTGTMQMSHTQLQALYCRRKQNKIFHPTSSCLKESTV